MPLANDFRWNAFNLAKIAKHRVTREEAEHVVRFAKHPRRHRRGSWLVEGRGNSNRKLRVIFIIDPAKVYYIIHAMPIR